MENNISLPHNYFYSAMSAHTIPDFFIIIRMWAPFTKSKGCSGSCEQKYLSASLRLVRIQSLARGHFSWALFECAPRWTCKQRGLCSRSRCCECLLEGTAALANTKLVLCAKAMRAMQISWWERTSQKPGFSHWADCISQLTYTDAATSPEPIYIQADALEKVYGLWLKKTDSMTQSCSVKGHTYSISMTSYSLKQIFCKIIQLQHNCYIIKTTLNIF